MTYQDFTTRYQYDPNKPFRHGGQAVVFEAFDTVTNEKVAIKRAPVKDPNSKYSVYQEFSLGKNFNHEYLVEYRDAYRLPTEMGTFDFGVMEFIDNGMNLNDYLKTYPNESALKDMLMRILEGVSYLHTNQVIHRDLKPHNILIKKEGGSFVPKIADFGVSKMLKNDETTSSAIVGTPEYMSPEQLGAGGGKVRYNSDLWTFGVIMYRMFTGEAPFGSVGDGVTVEEINFRIFDAKIPDDISVVDDPYKTVIQRCLVKDVNSRVQSVEDIINILNGKKEKVQPAPVKASYAAAATNVVNNPSPIIAPSEPVVSNENSQPAPAKKSSALKWIAMAASFIALLGVGGYYYTEHTAKQAILAQIDEAEQDYFSARYHDSFNSLMEIEHDKYFTPFGHYVLGEMYYHAYDSLESDSSKAAYHFEQAADGDIGEAMIHIGDLYSQGVYYEQDSVAARNWYDKSVEYLDRESAKDRATAWSGIGDIYSSDSKIAKKDLNKAFNGYKKASEMGFSYAQWQLGYMYQYGIGSSVDSAKAFKWYKESADKNDPSGQYYLGRAYESGFGTEVDEKKAALNYEKAAEKDIYGSNYKLGVFHYEGMADYDQDYKKAHDYFMKAADKNNANAQYYLGSMYRNGRGVRKNETEAFKFIRQAANNDLLPAQNSLGYYYDNGIGTKENDRKAFQWYKKAAEGGDKTGQYNLAFCYEFGTGVSKDLEQAAYWYKESMKNGNASAEDAYERISLKKLLSSN